MEPKKVFQVCSKCGHVQTVKLWPGEPQKRWQCSSYGCKRINDLKLEINVKEMEAL